MKRRHGVRPGFILVELRAVQEPSPSRLQTLVCAGRRLLGAVLLLLGILMMSTLLLLPVGLPLAHLALALIAAPGVYDQLPSSVIGRGLRPGPAVSRKIFFGTRGNNLPDQTV